jgi:ABC-type sulfate transport system substrate-binding protein
MKTFLKHCNKKKNQRRALKVALFIGTLLATINHYDMFLNANYEVSRFVKMGLTYIVPFCVSLYSSAMAGREIELTGKQ